MVGENLNIEILNAIFSEELTIKGCDGNDEKCEFCNFTDDVEKTELAHLFSDGLVVTRSYVIPFKGLMCQILRMGMKYQQAIVDLQKLEELEKEFS